MPEKTTAAGGRPASQRILRSAAAAAGLSQTAAAAAELLEEGDRAHAGIPTDARDLLLTEIEPDPAQPRRHFGEEELQTLADDIARRGVLQPILVRPPREPGGKYRLVSGERRWRASERAGRVRIPARVRDISDEDVQAAQLAENVLREDLSDIEKGRALRSLYEYRKMRDNSATWEDIANEVGLGRARISDLFNLASLPPPVAALIESGRLSGSHGVALQRAMTQLSEERIIELAVASSRPEGRKVGGYGMSVARLRHEIQRLVAPPPAPGGDPVVETAPITTVRLRPWVRRTIDALALGKLRPEERDLLLTALQTGKEEQQQTMAAGAASAGVGAPDRGAQPR